MHGQHIHKHYRAPSTRLIGWNYGRGYYFVTICTNGKHPFFGEIQNGIMQLSKIGNIAEQCCVAIPEHFPNVQLIEHIIMPDHVHIILQINPQTVETQNLASNLQTVVASNSPTSKLNNKINFENKFEPQAKNLASIIRGFKIGVTTNARQIDPFFMWQSRYHDRIIRDDSELNATREYIRNNPLRWWIENRLS
ncbi:MAG: transposase [Patescibacteria group bacterium]|jgi:REP element-mobilizing transposase RayT